MDKELEKLLKDGLLLSEKLTNSYKIKFAKRLKRLGVDLLYGAGNYPVALTYNIETKPIKRDSKIWEILRHIDLQTWNQA